MKIFDNLNIKAKFLLIISLPLFGFLVFAFFNSINYKREIDLLKRAKYNAMQVKALQNLIHEIQKERALTLANLERDKLHKQRKNTDDALIPEYVQYEQNLKILRQKVDSGFSLQTISNSYKELISSLTNEMLKLAGYIGYEMELVRTHTRITQIKESLSELEYAVLLVLRKNYLDRDSLFELITTKGELEHNQKQFFQIADEDFKTLYIQKILLNPKKEVLDKILNRIINRNEIQFSSTEWLATVSNLIEAQKEIQTAVIDRIIFSIDKEYAGFIRKFYFLTSLSLLFALFVIIIPLYLNRRMIFSIKALQDGLNKFLCFLEGKTDEYSMIPVYSKDEIGKTSEICNKSFLEIENLFLKLNEFNRKIEAILDAQESIVAIGRPVEGVNYLNKRFFEIFPYKNINDFLSKHKFLSELFVEKEGYLKKGTPEHHWSEQILSEPDKIHLAVMIDKFGQERIFSVNVRKVELETESFLVKIFTDVTEIETQRQKALEAEKAKTEFLSRMSHEIRTPITGIVGFFDLLSKTKLDDTQKRYISVIQNSIETLMSIINDILDMAKIEAGKMEIEYFNVNPFVELDRAITLFAPKARQKGLKYFYSIDPKIYECLIMPKEALKQVLSNLISNAIKFTETGQINIAVDVVEDFEDSQFVRFEVKDTGIGIPEDKQATVFEKFVQAHSYLYGGTGLGLSISYSLVKMIGGTLEFKSKVGEGSSFYFTIPLKKCTPESSLYKMFDNLKICVFKTFDERSEKIALMLGSWHISYSHIELSKAEKSFDIGIFFDKEDLERCLEKCKHLVLVSEEDYIEHEKVITIKGTPSQLYIAIMQTISFLLPKKEDTLEIKIPLKVLVAEDNEVNRMFFEELLKKYGIEVDFALNGAEAVEKVGEKKYDVVFMDISMPVMDGVEAAKLIKKDYPELPVVALTAHVLKGEMENLISSGFDDYLPKPVPIKEFERIIKKYAKIIYAEKTSKVEKTELDSFIERAKEKIRLPDETLFNLYKKFFETLGKKIEEISQSAIKNDRELLLILSHSLKGSSALLGIESISFICKEIEEATKKGQTSKYLELVEKLKKESQKLIEDYNKRVK